MKKSKIQQLKDTFYYVDNKPDLDRYGQFMMGLAGQEITNYIKVRANKWNVDKLIKEFIEISGCNTGSVYVCPKCRMEEFLMYRHDVERFADKLFDGKETYFD
jgi:hypothetical protein